ncbi:flagellar biosynthesis protein FlhB [Roseococcus sp. DSY-14]|uniref:EscU/YscU/HrcU family type III secretion system export apparatus switch protein n=1 Tax=Roseococcus sp. DSY-14 TaxID=3369650 RepID=UPI00387A934D
MAEEESEDDDDREEGTEPATPRKIQKAREGGNVPLSREAVGFATLLGTLSVAALLLPGQVSGFQAALGGALSRTHEWPAGAAAREWLRLFLGMVWPVAAVAILAAAAATLAQTRGAISARTLRPALSKLSPLGGFGRLFGAEGWLEFGRTCLKLAVVAGALWWVAGDLPRLGGLLEQPPGALLEAAGRGVLRLGAVALAVFFLLALGDVLLVNHRFLQGLRMTRKEQRDEMKESEGSPEVKGRQRQLRETLGRRRMLAEVPKAAVVVTNPTHYAVALAYEAGSSAAPRVVAKGVDAMAARIREAAQEAGVPIMPDPPLARALYRLELDAEIPAEHWDAVAKIIAYVLKLRGRR